MKSSMRVYKLFLFVIFYLLINLLPLSGQNIVEKNGLLKVEGNRIVNKYNEIVSLAGNSFFWSNEGWGGNQFYNSSVVNWLKDDWGSIIVRVAMGVEDYGGYLEKPEENLSTIKKVIDAAIEAGMYIIIDWHSHYAHLYTHDAVEFFKEMAYEYGMYDNIIYEIYNEPKYIDQTAQNDGKFATWQAHIKPYAETVIAEIRDIDPDNLIVVGTGEWSQKVDDAANDPIEGFSNIAYALHFYSVNHKQWLRNRASDALSKGIAIMVTEWGPMGNSSDDPESDAWMQWCVDNKISHCAWAVNDKDEPWSIVKPGSSKTGSWTPSDLTSAGIYEKNIIKNWMKTTSSSNRTNNEQPVYFQLAPNPFTETLQIKTINNSFEIHGCQILDLNGRSIIEIDNLVFADSGYSLNIKSLDKGAYIIVLSTNYGPISRLIAKQ
jgi:endoglucanase